MINFNKNLIAACLPFLDCHCCREYKTFHAILDWLFIFTKSTTPASFIKAGTPKWAFCWQSFLIIFQGLAYSPIARYGLEERFLCNKKSRKISCLWTDGARNNIIFLSRRFHRPIHFHFEFIPNSDPHSNLSDQYCSNKHGLMLRCRHDVDMFTWGRVVLSSPKLSVLM